MQSLRIWFQDRLGAYAGWLRPTPALVIAAGAMLASPDVAAEDAGASSFATSMFEDEREVLWPIDLQLDIKPLDATSDDDAVHRSVVITDGQWTSFHHAVKTPAGVDSFRVEMTAHHHARQAIEIEYDLEVQQTPYERTTVAAYVLHRLNLGPAPELGRKALQVAKADIVPTRGEPVLRTVTIGDRRYEVRLSATRLRG